MGFLVLLIVTVGATALGIVVATGILVLLFHLMRPAKQLPIANGQLPSRVVGTW